MVIDPYRKRSNGKPRRAAKTRSGKRLTKSDKRMLMDASHSSRGMLLAVDTVRGGGGENYVEGMMNSSYFNFYDPSEDFCRAVGDKIQNELLQGKVKVYTAEERAAFQAARGPEIIPPEKHRDAYVRCLIRNARCMPGLHRAVMEYVDKPRGYCFPERVSDTTVRWIEEAMERAMEARAEMEKATP